MPMLGVELDHRITWQNHIDYVCQKTELCNWYYQASEAIRTD